MPLPTQKFQRDQLQDGKPDWGPGNIPEEEEKRQPGSRKAFQLSGSARLLQMLRSQEANGSSEGASGLCLP